MFDRKPIIKHLFFFFILILNQNVLANCHWQDPPDSNSFFLLLEDSPAFKPLRAMLDEYHNVDKTNYNSLGLRVEKLEVIYSEAKKLLDHHQWNDYAQLSLSTLADISINKSQYLRQLQQLYKKYNDDFDTIACLYKATDDNQHSLLELVNEIYYSPHLQEEIGLFWLEATDPCHRQLIPYWKKWNKLKNTTLFFLWLEEQNVPVQVSKVNYIADEKLKAHVMQTTDHGVKLSNETLTSNEYLFIINMEQQILICQAKPGFRHTSLSHGKPIIAAGSLWFEDNQVIKVSFKSGHYRPTSFQYRQGWFFLKEKRLLGKIKTVEYYKGTEFVSQHLTEFEEWLSTIDT